MNADICTLDEIAELFGVTEKAVRDWVGLGLPVITAGSRGGGREKTTISLRAAVAWYFTNKADQIALERERTRVAKSQADKTEMENAVRRAELGVIDEVAAWFAGHVQRCKARLIQLPDELGQFLDPVSARVAVDEARRLVSEALEELAKDIGARDRSDPSELEATAHANGKRMGGRKPKAVKRKQRGAGAVAN